MNNYIEFSPSIVSECKDYAVATLIKFIYDNSNNASIWLKMSNKEFSEKLRCFTPNQVRYAINKSIELNLLEKKHFSSNIPDRTYSYMLTEKAKQLIKNDD